MDLIDKKLARMSNDELTTCYHALMNIDPTIFGPNGWAEKWSGDFTMDDWGMAVCSEMDKRGLKKIKESCPCCSETTTPTFLNPKFIPISNMLRKAYGNGEISLMTANSIFSCVLYVYNNGLHQYPEFLEKYGSEVSKWIEEQGRK